MKIYKLPEILIFQFKRFKEVSNSTGKPIFEKDDTPVSYPTSFEHCEASLTGDGAANYRLKAAICHSGSLKDGNYIAYGRNEDDWYEFNDIHLSRNVNPVRENAYMLFYEKIQCI